MRSCKDENYNALLFVAFPQWLNWYVTFLALFCISNFLPRPDFVKNTLSVRKFAVLMITMVASLKVLDCTDGMVKWVWFF